MTKDRIFDAAYGLALKRGVHNTMKKHIAAHLKCGMGTVNYHWKTMASLRRAILRTAHAAGAAEYLAVLAGK